MRNELEKIGFNNREIDIYLTLLQMGKSTAGTIAKELSLDRRVVYDSLNLMAKKGRIFITKVKNVLHYVAVSPEEILKEADNSVDNFKKIIPELNNLKIKTEIGEVRNWFGISAINRIVDNALESNEDVLLMGRGGYLISQMGESRFQYIEKLKKIKWKMIQTKEYKNFEREFKPKRLRYLPMDTKLDTGFMVFDDKLYLFTKKQNIEVIEIVDQSFADTYKTYFNIFWNLSKE